MRNIWTIAAREFKLYFSSPAAYLVATMLLVVMGIIFYTNVVGSILNQFPPNTQVVLGPLVTLLLFATPAITMRLLAEEQRQGTLELLLTAPVRDYELIVGKWLGGFLFMLSILALTWLYPIFLNQIVDPGIDQGILVSGYLGVILFMGSLVAIGVAVSSLFSNQIAVFFTTLGVFLVLWLISLPTQAMGATGGELLRYLDFSEHFYSTFYQGVIDLSDIIYFLSLTALALFLGTMSLESRRWR
ncbi:MAG: ABC transporter permease [Anaerolineales bacterium]|nr:MAG: ABC transporter permease [Anaerolineales bacterium]